MFRPTAALLAVALLAACQSTAPAPGSATIAIGALHRVPMAGPVQIEGRVTARFEGLGGFFVQDAGDGQAATSDAVFVAFEEGAPAPSVSVGDRMRVRGISKEYSELLHHAGVITVKELQYRNPANLAKAMAEANRKRKLVRFLPSEKVVERWIEHAKKLPLKISY